MANSPWGEIQTSTRLADGVRWVSTASHGGLMVTRKVAEAQLSAKAISAARYGGWYCDHLCFEEDCEYAVAFYEHPEWARAMDIQVLEEWYQVRRKHAARAREYPKLAATTPDTYMSKAAEEQIPKLEIRIAMSNGQVKAEMAETVRHWNPEYFAESVAPSV